MIRIAVIGAGNNGKGHARYYRESSRTELVGIADPDAERVSAAAAEFNCRAEADYRELLGDVDAVVISSPNHLHHEHAITCADAGKHVFCEKPMGLDRQQAEEITAAVRRNHVRSGVGFSVRFGPTLQTMLRMVNEGQVGELLSIWSRRLTRGSGRRGAKTGHWRQDSARSGGVLFEINVHELDWMMWLGGDVRTVYARKYAEDVGVPRANDHIWITLGFADGPVGTHEGSWIAPQANYYRGLQGSEGTLDTEEWGNRLRFTRVGEDRVEDLELDERYDLRGNFLDCIEHGADPVADVEWGLKVMTVADAAIDSALSGDVVKL